MPETDVRKNSDAYSPPQDKYAEQAVLGAVMKDSKSLFTIIDYFKTGEHFYFPKHETIYRSILNLYEKNEPYDITTVADELTKMGKLEKIGGRVYLIELVGLVVSTANIEYYANIVLEKSLLRRLINASNDIIESSYLQKIEIGDLLDFAEKTVFSIAESYLRTEFTPLKDLMPKTFEQIEEFQETKGGIVGIETGYNKLDEIMGGLHNGDLIVIAGRPSMGKTAFALNIAENIAIDKNLPVGIFSIEMSKEQLALRLLCGRAKISQHLLRSGRLKDADYQRLPLAMDKLGDADIIIDDSPTLSSLEIRAKARRMKAQYNVGMIIIDYIQMMHAAGKFDNRQQEMALISRSLKTLAKELEIPVIAISQLSRAVEQRGGDKRPQLSDLRESGAIEQDADVVMFVYRPEFYLMHLEEDDPKRLEVQGMAEIIVSKQRNGPTGTARLTFVKEFIRFENMSTQYQGMVEQEEDADAPF